MQRSRRCHRHRISMLCLRPCLCVFAADQHSKAVCPSVPQSWHSPPSLSTFRDHRGLKPVSVHGSLNLALVRNQAYTRTSFLISSYAETLKNAFGNEPPDHQEQATCCHLLFRLLLPLIPGLALTVFVRDLPHASRILSLSHAPSSARPRPA